MFPRELAGSRTGTENTQDESEASCSTRKQRSAQKKLKGQFRNVNGTQGPAELSLAKTGRIWAGRYNWNITEGIKETSMSIVIEISD